MVLLSISIVIALIVTIGLPIAASIWLIKRLNVSWRVISYGALAFFILQTLITLLFNGFAALVQNEMISPSEQAFINAQIIMGVLLGAILGVLIRWAGMKFLRADLDNLESAYGVGVGYGGVESILLVGLPLLLTFITMLSNINIDPQTTALDPSLVAQIEELWHISAYIPLAGAVERVTAFVMHITVTVLILQVFKTRNILWLTAAIGLELLVNGLILGLSQVGLMPGWVMLISVVLMMGNLIFLFRLNAFEFDITKAEPEALRQN